MEESSGKNSAGREEEESRSRWCEGISIARFTRLTCDAAARAGERAEKKELFTFVLSSEGNNGRK